MSVGIKRYIQQQVQGELTEEPQGVLTLGSPSYTTEEEIIGLPSGGVLGMEGGSKFGVVQPRMERKLTLSNLTEDTKDFLKDVEGFETSIYVPVDKKTKKVLGTSGPTIASGFDLGQRNLNDLKSYGLPQSIEDKLKPYLGKKGKAAEEYIKKNPLNLTDEEANTINNIVKQKEADKVEKKFNENSELNFKELPDPIKTMITSVAFQYGIEAIEKPEKGAPNWWKQVTTGDWEGAYNNLRDFGDKYKTRRNREADLIMEMKNNGSITGDAKVSKPE